MKAPEPVHLIKRANRSLALAEILKSGHITKRELAERTALSFPTASKIVDDMETKGQLKQAGTTDPINGRKAAVYELNPDYAHILCVYFQYDAFHCVVGDALTQIVSAESSVVTAEGYIKTLELIIDKHLAQNPNIQAISIGVPASVRDRKIQFINHYEELQDFELARHIERKFSLPTVAERDMNAMMGAIRLQKEYEREENLALAIVTADGPGSSALIDGHLLKGASGIAGEIGFLPLYGRENLQELALSGFAGTDLTDYMAKIIACIAVTTNPRKLIILKTAYSPENLEGIQMTEQEKMLAGEPYDCGDSELLDQWHRAKIMVKKYNNLDSGDAAGQARILNELLGGRGEHLWITAPFYADYGKHIYFGNHCEVNMNCTFLDDNKIVIGDYALIAPNVQIYTAFHPTDVKRRRKAQFQQKNR